MNSRFLFLVIGLILGALAGYLISSNAAQPNHQIVAEGFHNTSFVDGNFEIELVSRIDKDNVKVCNNISMPTAGFPKSFSGMENVVARLVNDGIILRGQSTAGPAETVPTPPSE